MEVFRTAKCLKTASIHNGAMTLTPAPIVAVADRLLEAWRGGSPADDAALQGHLTDLEQAYAVQDRVLAALGGGAQGPQYWKSGGPTRNDPMRHAPLPPAGVRPVGSGLAGLNLRHRWIEAEIALRIGREVTPAQALELSWPQAGELVDAMCVSIELVDSRWASSRQAPPLLRVAELLLHGALVLGEFVPFSPRDWAQQECRVRIGGADVQSFRGSLGVGDPAWVLPACIRHATRHGAALPAGSVITTGTWCGLLEAQAGERVEVEFPGVGAASVQF